MSKSSSEGAQPISRARLAELLNEDLSREYQAIILCRVLAGVEGCRIYEHRGTT